MDLFDVSCSQGTVVELQECDIDTTLERQKWTVTNNRIESQLCPGMCVDVEFSKVADGSAIKLWTCSTFTTNNAQLWSENGSAPTPSPTTWYDLESAVSSAPDNRCLEVANSDPQEDTEVKLMLCNDSPSQMWATDSDSHVHIQADFNYCLDIRSPCTSGTEIVVKECKIE